MKIFIPEDRDRNPYLSEIENFSQHNFFYSSAENFDCTFQVVLIQWPERIFKWKEPTRDQLQDLDKDLNSWKTNAKIVYVVHDEKRVLGETPLFNRLFEIVEKHADLFIHLGQYSRLKFQKKYPAAIHQVLNHPLYSSSFTYFEKEKARKKLGIPHDFLVVLSAGRIRKKAERDLVLRAFKEIPTEKKTLVSNNMLPFRTSVEFKGRVWLKKFFHINEWLEKRIGEKYKLPQYYFNYKFSSFEELSLMMSACDILLIPRIDILNSGNIFLGLTYHKVMVGPAIGNIKEHLDRFNFPSFKPNSQRSVSKAIREAIELHSGDRGKYFSAALDDYKPECVAKKFDVLIESLVS